MTTNAFILIQLAYAVLAVEGDRIDGHGDHGRSHGYGQGSEIMRLEILRTTGIEYHPLVWYSREGTVNAMVSYWQGWSRRINGRTVTISDLTPGQVAALWGAGPGAMDRRMGRRDGPYAVKVRREYNRRVTTWASK